MELREMQVINEEMLQEQKEQLVKVEDDYKGQLDQQAILVKQVRQNPRKT